MKLSKLISFAASEDGEEIAIHLDESGIDYLIEELTRLKAGLSRNECEHAHQMSPDCGGEELSSVMLKDQESELVSVCHVKIYAWTDVETYARLGLTGC